MNSNSRVTRFLIGLVSSTMIVGQAMASADSIVEGFGNVGTLTQSGWIIHNNSDSGGTTSWFQGDSTIFNAQAGPAQSYISANFDNTAGPNATISNWLLTPVLSFGNGSTLTFYTKSDVPAGFPEFPDRLEVRLSQSGASSDVGTSNVSTGAFSTLLLTINPGIAQGIYPANWTMFTLTHADGIPESGTGRIAFRYFVTDAGPLGQNSNYIGIDSVLWDSIAPFADGFEAPDL